MTDILDTFGELVYERLKKKSAHPSPGSKMPVALPDTFTPEMVVDSARVTCQKWFLRIASVRELLPRRLVETAILRSRRFLAIDGPERALDRIAGMMRGIGDPLVAAYARAYLCRVGWAVAPLHRSYLLNTLKDSLRLEGDAGEPRRARPPGAGRRDGRLPDLFRPAID